MMMPTKKLFIFLLLFGYTVSVIAQVDNEPEDLYSDLFGEEVTCDNVIDIFAEYNSTVNLMRFAFRNSLNNMNNWLEDANQNGAIKHSDLQRQQQQITEARSLMDDSGLDISSKGSDILFVLTECLQKP